MRAGIAFLSILLAGVSGCETLNSDGGTGSLSQYQGTYQFPDGSIVTGGRLDESGQSTLLYIDPADGEPAGIFSTGRSPFQGIFGARASIEFEAEGEILYWRLPSGAVHRAERLSQPDTRAATFSNGEVALSGTLHLPHAAKHPIPAIVLAHGSGPANRHAGPWITFFVNEGYAVLSFDKRGEGGSSGDWRESTYIDLAEDTVAAAAWLARQNEIDARRIGLKTSSQSGWYGPLAVERSDNLSFLIQRAAPAVNIGVGTAHEIAEEMRADQVPENQIDAAIAFWEELHLLARDGASLGEANRRFDAIRDQPWFEAMFSDRDTIEADWWRIHGINMRLEPAATAATLDEPVLWFLAELDENVPYAASVAALRRAQESKDNLSVVTVKGARHSFLVTGANGQLRYTDQYWSRMADWLSDIAR